MGCCEKKKTDKEQKMLENSEAKNEIMSLIDEDTKDTKVNSLEETNTKIEIDDKKLKYEDFEPLKLLGTGCFGRVLLVRKKSNHNLYAMKILLKSDLKQKHQEEHIKTERDLMVLLNSPFIMNIKYAFQDDIQLYIV